VISFWGLSKYGKDIAATAAISLSILSAFDSELSTHLK
jgi:hypothetical protein